MACQCPMTSKTLNITAISPIISYTGAWTTKIGATTNSDISVAPLPNRDLRSGFGALTTNGFSERLTGESS